MSIKAIIFDMDGLMFDTEKLWLNSVVMTNKFHGYSVSESLIIECMGKRQDKIDQILKERLGQNFDTEEFRKLNKFYMKKEVEETGLKIKNGLKELVEYLQKEGYKLAIASSSKMERVNERFKQSGFSSEPFHVIVSGDMVKEPKPNPEIYLKCLKKLNIKADEAIALEDSESGLLSAINAGIKAVLIPDLKLPSKEVLKLIYKKLNNLTEVITLLENENKI